MTEPRSDGSDAVLIARILLGGDRSEVDGACRILVERYWKVVLVLLRVRCKVEQDAEDLAQEAFLRAFRSLGKLQDPRLFLGWLLRITRNLATDHLRRRRRETSLESLAGELAEGLQCRRAAVNEVCEKVERDEEIEMLMRAVERLPDRYRTVVTLRYLKGFSNRELAERLGEPEGTIRNRIFRALGKLKAALEPRASAVSPPDVSRAIAATPDKRTGTHR
jgi:RNA polymerase sigma-70 factor (ECF subfamily)